MIIESITDNELVNLYYEYRQKDKEKYKTIVFEMARRAKTNNNPILVKALNELCLGQSKQR